MLCTLSNIGLKVSFIYFKIYRKLIIPLWKKYQDHTFVTFNCWPKFPKINKNSRFICKLVFHYRMISRLFPVAVLSIKALEPFYLVHWSQYRLQYVINEIKETMTDFIHY